MERGRKQDPRFIDPLSITDIDIKANVVVPLFGKERSPEMLVEVGAALAKGKRLQVAHITEIPDQTQLDAVLEDDALAISLNRRISAMAEEKQVEVKMTSLVTHELLDTVQAISERTHCQWIVMGWTGRRGYGLWVKSPIRWLITHLSCNVALFRDAGVRYIRQILVYPEPGLHEQLVTDTADHLAEIYSAGLTFIKVISPDTTEEEKDAESTYIYNLIQTCNSPAEALIISQRDSLQAIIDASVRFDLMVMGTPGDQPIVKLIRGIQNDKLFANAACSVLEVATPRDKRKETKPVHLKPK